MASMGAEMWADSSIICAEIYEELDIQAEDSSVTIIIDASTTTTTTTSRGGEGDASLGASQSYIALHSVPFDDEVFVRRSLEECLKLASSCHEAEACCFLCPESYSSFTDLKRHFTQVHNLTQSFFQPSNLTARHINQLVMEIKALKCHCTGFICTTCGKVFSYMPQLMNHILMNHPTTYATFPFFTKQQQIGLNPCQQCTIIEKLCQIDYDLFVKVLLECGKCSSERSKLLLKSWPLTDCSEPCMWCAEEAEYEEAGCSGVSYGTDFSKREVACYRIKQALKKKQSLRSKLLSMCICPLLKCPDCPKTVASYADLCKHIRLTSHSSWHNMKILWEKYRIIKENCPVCPQYSYHCYILCPHCPHTAFESEKAAQAHMDMNHKPHAAAKDAPLCTCPNHFICLKCGASHPTPQSLHRHLQETKHMTERNLAAIPAMIERSIRGRETCPRCSLQDSITMSESDQEQECSCQSVECPTCKSSFRKVSSLLKHTDQAKHFMSTADIRREKEKLAVSVKTCLRCCSGAERYCILCHQREDLLHTHLMTRHQDSQIMLLRDVSGSVLEEGDVAGWDEGRPARYECSVCLRRFPSIVRLRHHVRHRHPHCHFSLFCLDMSGDVLQVKDFAAHEEFMVLSIASM